MGALQQYRMGNAHAIRDTTNSIMNVRFALLGVLSVTILGLVQLVRKGTHLEILFAFSVNQTNTYSMTHARTANNLAQHVLMD